MSTINVIHASLADVQSDVIVNLISSNSRSLQDAGAVSKALLASGGQELQTEYAAHPVPRDFGKDVVITKATGRIRSRFVLHAAISAYRNERSIQLLYNLVELCLNKTVELRMKKIAFPTLGCGQLRYDPVAVANCFMCAVQACEAVLEISIVAFDQTLYDTFKQCLDTANNANVGPAVVAMDTRGGLGNTRGAVGNTRGGLGNTRGGVGDTRPRRTGKGKWNFLQENPTAFNCPICMDDIQPREGLILTECGHSFCKDCMKGYIASLDTPEAVCPLQQAEKCTGLVRELEIRSLVDEAAFETYLQRSVKLNEAQQSANTYHCKTPDCEYWIEYAPDAKLHARTCIFCCPVCYAENCLRCDASHPSLTCDDFQNSRQVNIDAKQTEAEIAARIQRGEAMRCPSCTSVIEKTIGCDALVCTSCKMEICWATKGPRWGPKGRGDTSGGCRCNYVGGQKCHPQCQNCH